MLQESTHLYRFSRLPHIDCRMTRRSVSESGAVGQTGLGQLVPDGHLGFLLLPGQGLAVSIVLDLLVRSPCGSPYETDHLDSLLHYL